LEQFNEIYQQHYPTVFRLVSRFTLGSHETDDIVQDVFVKLYLQIEAGVVVLYPKTWLYKVATNACLNTLSRNKETHSIDKINDLETSTTDSIDTQIENAEQQIILQRALFKLKENERIIVILYSEGLSYKEIAEISGIRFSSIGKSLSRSLEKLKTLLKNQYDEMLNK